MSQVTSTQTPALKSRLGAILRATSGNFLEQFDFFLFGFYAPIIGKAFFPSENETAVLLLTFGVFWLGALMRPVGAVVLGAYIDRIGRRKGLIVTLTIMAMGTVTIALCPDYARIGVAAPIIVLIGRLLQGFSAGVELGGVSVYLAEIATPGNRGFIPRSNPPASRSRFLSPRSSVMSSTSMSRATPSDCLAGLNSPSGEFPSLSAASSFPSSSSFAARWKKRRNFWR